jgi:MinD superfamily P-loop ATPase
MAGIVEIDIEKCDQCLLCIKLCPASALIKQDKRPVMLPAGLNECMACGDCVAFCEPQAMTLTRSHSATGFFKTLEHGDLQFPRL